MTKIQIARTMRANLDRDNPGWRDRIRQLLDTERPGWVAHVATVPGPNGRMVRVALLANPERVPDPSEVDPATDPLAGFEQSPSP